MWYFAWILGVLLACAFGIINALWLEHSEMMDKTVSNLADKVAKLHAPMDKTLLRVLALILGFMHVGLVMWDPNAYHREIGGFNAFIAPALIWACCSSMVYGVGLNRETGTGKYCSALTSHLLS